MNSAWPIDPVLLLGLRGGPGEGAIRSRVSRGPHRQRPLYSATPEPLDGEVVMTGQQFDLFRGWGKFTLEEWTQPFDLPEPGTLVTRAWQFTARPTWVHDVQGQQGRGVWRVQVSLESIP